MIQVILEVDVAVDAYTVQVILEVDVAVDAYTDETP